MEQYRKQAKSLVRAFRAGDADAVRRAEAVLGGRAAQRFLLSDAQHVVACEAGHRLAGAVDVQPPLLDDDAVGDLLPAGRAARAARRLAQVVDVVVAAAAADTHEHRLAVRPREAGVDRPLGPVIRSPQLEPVFVSCKRERLDWVVGRVAGASLALYLALLELEE